MGTDSAAETKPARRRRRGQSGSIIKRGSGWAIIYRNPDGKQKWEGGFDRKDDAKARLDEVLGSIRSNTYVERKDISFEDFCTDFMTKAKAILKPKTWASYQSALDKWITPKFGKWLVCDISRAAVKNFRDELLCNRDLSRKFVKNVMALLHRLFEEAIDREYISANPARKMPKDVPDEHSDDSDTVMPTPEEVANTFAKLSPTYQVLLAAAAVTGFRRGELLGLFWNDIDWLNSTIRVRRSLQRIPKKLLDGDEFRKVERIGTTGLAIVTPKSRKSLRIVEMPPRLASLLRSLRSLQSGNGQFVFQSDSGAPLDPDAVYGVWHAAQREAKSCEFGLHALRHLYASLLHDSGAPVKVAQERLGHAHSSTTLDIYTRSITKEGREFAAAVEAAFPFVSNLLAEAPEQEKRPSAGSR